MDGRRIHITGNQALKLMRAARAKQIVMAVPVVDPYDISLSRVSTIDELGIGEIVSWLDVSRNEPLDVLSSSRESRCRISGTHPHIVSTIPPLCAALELKQVSNTDALHWDQETRVFIDAPPLALAHAAHCLGEFVSKGSMNELEAQLRLIALACELCGSYARDPLDPRGGTCFFDEPGQCNRFVGPDELRAALHDMQGSNGLVRARKAAAHALDFSGSPMETYLDLGLFLPPRLAGLSLHMPLLNQQLVVTDEVRNRLRHKSLRPDMQWPEQHLLGEYYGDEEHSSKDARIEDKNRVQDYATAGYSPVLLMYDDVKGITQLNATAERLARMLMERGLRNELYRVRRIMRGDGFRAKQNVLAKTLLPPVKRYEEA